MQPPPPLPSNLLSSTGVQKRPGLEYYLFRTDKEDVKLRDMLPQDGGKQMWSTCLFPKMPMSRYASPDLRSAAFTRGRRGPESQDSGSPAP